LPSDLLLRRPDLVQAEQTLIAANARVAVARAAYFPRSRSPAIWAARAWRCGLVYRAGRDLAGRVCGGQPIYAGGRIDAQLQAAGARERRRSPVPTRYPKCLPEVRDALVSQAKARSGSGR